MYVRKISCNELLYLDMQDLTNTYAIQYLFEVEKLKNISIIENTINSVIKNNFGTNVKLKKDKYYIVDKNIIINKVKYNGKDLYECDIFYKKINYKEESFQVYLIEHKNKKYLLFRFLHSVCDGKGSFLFIENFINILQEKELIKCSNVMTDREFIKQKNYISKNESKIPTVNCEFSHNINEYKQKWKIIEIDHYVPSIISKLACILTKEFKSDKVKFMIPTDLRRHDKKNNYIGNLTLPIFLDVQQNDDYQKVNGRLLYSIKNNEELNIKNTSYYGYEHIPRKLRKFILKSGIKLINKSNKFCIGAIISHLGRIDLDKYKNKELSFTDFVSLPIQQPLGAFSIVIAEHSKKTVIALSYYQNQFTDDYMNNLCNKIKNNLSYEIYNINQTKHEYKYNYLYYLKEAFSNNKNEIAIFTEKEQYTYNDLEKNIKKYIKYFNENNITKGKKVILYLDRSFEYVSLYLACVLKNITFVPVDKNNTIDKVNKIIKTANADLIITDNLIDGNNVINPKEIKDNNSNIEIDYSYNPNHILYEIYTSGTTGIPKCVPIRNFNFNNYILWARDTYITKERLIMPLFTSISVDLTITSSFLPFVTFGAIKIFKEKFNSNVIKKIFGDKEINVVKLTPTHLSFIINEKYNIQGKEILILGGEDLKPSLCKKSSNILNDCKIYNEYGPSEATVGTIYHLYNKNDTKLVPIGKPIYNTKVLLYDKKIITEPNKTGEILISGDSVFLGYLNKNDDCFIKINNEKFYKTGDLAYIKNNDFYYLGRKDNQVKIKGNRVELSEIQNEINNINDISDNLVLFKNNHLYSFIVSNKNIKESMIREVLRKKFPSYMIPSKILILKKFPILSNGKVDIDKLLSNIKLKVNKHNDYKYDNKILNIAKQIKNDIVLETDKTLFEIGLESFDIIVLLQKIADNYIDDKKEEKFINYIITRLDKISIYEIEKIVVKFGGSI